MRLPVGGDPLYSPSFVPEHRKRPTTVFPSATSSAISICQSGKAERNVIKDRFMGLANSGVKSSSTTSRLPPFMASIRRRTMALFSADMILLPASWGQANKLRPVARLLARLEPALWEPAERWIGGSEGL